MVKRVERVGQKKPWRILAAPLPREWGQIPKEIESELGVELYLLARQLRLFADSPAELAGKLFAPGRHVAERRTEALHEAPASLRPSLRLLMRITSSRPPESEEAAFACETVALWADDSGYPDTAVHFAEAAAIIHPTAPYFAFLAARTNRLAGDPWRAEVFYGRAIRYAYRQQDWDVYVRARLGLGRLHADRGRLLKAANHYSSAARVAVDQGHDWLAAQTYHDIFPLFYELGDTAKAHVVAKKAIETYPRHHERYPVAVHDFLLLLVFERHYAEAWPLLEQLVKAPLRSHDQVLIWGTIARVAGSLDMPDRYAEAEARVLELAPHWDSFAPAAYLGLAAGAHALGDRSLAAAYAERGLTLARDKQDRQAQRLLNELVSELAAARPAPPPVKLHPDLAEGLRTLSAVVEDEIASWRSDSTWTARENQSGLWTLGPV